MDSRNAIDEAMLYCTTLPNLRCGLFICTEVEYDVVCELIDGYKNNFEIKPSHKGAGWTLTFNNGSMIYIMRLTNDANDGVCAPRLHMVYISEHIEQEVFNVVVCPMLIPYQFRDVIKFIGIGECGNLKQTK